MVWGAHCFGFWSFGIEESALNTHGRHLLAEYYDCDRAVLNDTGALQHLFEQAASAAGATIVQAVFHGFSPHGISGIVVIKESHLSIHTWPEHGYAAVDFYTCGCCDPYAAHETLKHGLGSQRHELMMIERGGMTANPPFAQAVYETHDMPGMMQIKRS